MKIELKSGVACLLLFFLLTGCISYKPQNAKKVRGKLYEEFFVGEKGMQYFIKPLKFEAQETDYIVVADFTFCVKEQIKATDSVIVNFTLFTENPANLIDSIALKNATSSFAINSLNMLFKEKSKKGYKVRYSSTACLMPLQAFFKADKPVFFIYQENQQFAFLPTKRTSRNMLELHEEIFQLYRVSP